MNSGRESYKGNHVWVVVEVQGAAPPMMEMKNVVLVRVHGPRSARHAAQHELNPVDGVELVQHQIKVLMAAQALVSAPFIDVTPDVNGHCV